MDFQATASTYHLAYHPPWKGYQNLNLLTPFYCSSEGKRIVPQSFLTSVDWDVTNSEQLLRRAIVKVDNCWRQIIVGADN
jgi:hypothetical protein